MNFIVDEQLPPALALWIGAKGCAAVHVRDLGLRGAVDDDVWQRCLDARAVIVTKDEDFVARRSRIESGPPQVLWIRLGNASNDALIQWLTPRWTEAIDALDAGAVLVELR